jgi:hypothetical protein
MLKIRAAQMNVLRQPIRRSFEDRMVAHLRATFASQFDGFDEDALRLLIRAGITKAERYRITAAPDVSRYIECMARYGADFDTAARSSEARAILLDPSLDAAAKLDRLGKQNLTPSEG